MFAKSVKLAKDGGSWQYLLEICMPEWLNAKLVGQDGQPFEFLTRDAEGVPGPKVDSNTRTAYFRIRNWYGGSSECQLFSIDNIGEIASKVKNKYFSGMYFIELSNWEDQRVLSMTLPSLRLGHLIPTKGQPDIYHQWMADTNPHEDLGANSWFYKLWYLERNKPPVGDSEDDRERAEFLSYLDVINIHWKDNPFATREQILGLKYSCGDDRAVYESHYLGIHGEGGVKKEKHFSTFFIRSKHVVGGGEDEGDQIDIHKSSSGLYSGWDLGNVNHAVVLLDKWPRVINDTEVMCWSVLDELVYIGEQVSLADFALEILAKMDALNRPGQKAYEWLNWSDDSAINVFRPTTGSYDYKEILAATRGRIYLHGVKKPHGSVQVRVRIVKHLLKENRLFISSRCTHVIDMLENLRKAEDEYIVRDKHIHVFDGMSYPLLEEMQEELLSEAFTPTATKPGTEEDQEERRIISV